MEAYRQYLAFVPTQSEISSSKLSSSQPSTPPNPESSDDDKNIPIPLDVPLEKPQYAFTTFSSPSDPKNPKNWSIAYKGWVIALLSWLTLSLTFSSSASSAAEEGVIEEFRCSQIAATATTSSFLIGMGLGAMPSAPLSELHGRLPVYAITLLLATIFEIASAVAPNITSLIILRFIAGFMSAAPLSNAGGSLNDIGNPLARTITLPLFATTGFVGPVLGPIIGGFLTSSPKLGWRWCFWFCAIWNAGAFVTTVIFMPETHTPALLKYKAIRFRRITGDLGWRAEIEEETLGEATKRSLKRPFKMLVVEPVVQFFVLYLTVVYICLYGFFEAYPVVFKDHGLTLSEIGLTFIPVMIGFFILLGFVFLHYKRYIGLARDAGNGVQRRGIHDGKVEPEERLVPLLFACILLPISLFWFAWTAPARFSIWILMMSGIPFGLGLLAVFQASYQYMIDAYGPFAASALAGATLVRYVVSGIVILGVPAMFNNLGHEWATSLFGFLGAAMVPVPFVFYIYGRRVRAKCQFTVRD